MALATREAVEIVCVFRVVALFLKMAIVPEATEGAEMILTVTCRTRLLALVLKWHIAIALTFDLEEETIACRTMV
jgi:hypothetical protein